MASTDGDILPSYNTLFPEDEPAANQTNGGRRRCTTITLREIYYPSGCPCHPGEKKADKKGKRKQQDTAAPTNQFRIEDSLDLPQWLEQRQLELEQQHIRRFEILKSTTLGLVFPQNLRLEVVEVDPDTREQEQEHDTARPCFTTSNMKWWKNKLMLPPSFDIFPSPQQGTWHESESSGQVQGQESAEKPYPLAHIEYPGWQGVTQMTINLTLYNITREMHYEHNHDPAEPRSLWTVSRLGSKREYVIKCTTDRELNGYKWHSMSSSELTSIPALDDGHSWAHGNLVLSGPDDRLVAAYRQRRDYRVLGSLTIFTDTLHHDIGTRPVLTIDAITASCLSIILYERVAWQNLLGN
ncbi:hypothetical protein PV08_00854 [Exophiala spinifera]|uniref:Uncharacterized protein n=1 Tax=Exophiala spinifera TaxID=91928 RepID=A0A0D2C9L8_9EURO|nr:uncharacterized protein PV08_00854 [Exophiala spinifera]KIW20279.1 hypothetical protein PV08_00854 [Exophiala spinifera]